MSDGTGYVAALVLAGVLAWAGLAKLRRPTLTTRGFAALGLPGAAVLATFVPLVELGLAAGLVVWPRDAAVGTIVLLTAFTAVLARAVATGNAASCGCFGTSRRTPVSFVELVRNAVLAVAAVAALTVARPTVPGLDDVVLVTTLTAVAAVALALCEVRRAAGGVWAVDLQGGPGA